MIFFFSFLEFHYCAEQCRGLWLKVISTYFALRSDSVRANGEKVQQGKGHRAKARERRHSLAPT